jgi:hypothetical protein
VSKQVTTPQPVPGYATEEVLVETFEEGIGVAHYMRCAGPLNTQIVALGVDAYLKVRPTQAMGTRRIGKVPHRTAHPSNHLAAMLVGSR